VADVGCGKGALTLFNGKSIPKSRFFGFDYHAQSIEGARESASVTGLPTASRLRWRKQRSFRARITTLLRSSTACMTWETQSGCGARPADIGQGWHNG